ncbi:hypothetical protein [Isoptericola croceus]|uniref:hypothetical protein n=1 Tax=Isoptericola croceus TaxID=3031406 RepID=UPI0023F942EB|nr:hypothetical protein [Isoptericola croceus]
MSRGDNVIAFPIQPRDGDDFEASLTRHHPDELAIADLLARTHQRWMATGRRDDVLRGAREGYATALSVLTSEHRSVPETTSRILVALSHGVHSPTELVDVAHGRRAR